MVFGAPLELLPGLGIDRTGLAARLDELGYARRDHARRAGEYAVEPDALTLIPREGPQEGRIARIRFAPAGGRRPVRDHHRDAARPARRTPRPGRAASVDPARPGPAAEADRPVGGDARRRGAGGTRGRGPSVLHAPRYRRGAHRRGRGDQSDRQPELPRRGEHPHAATDQEHPAEPGADGAAEAPGTGPRPPARAAAAQAPHSRAVSERGLSRPPGIVRHSRRRPGRPGPLRQGPAEPHPRRSGDPGGPDSRPPRPTRLTGTRNARRTGATGCCRRWWTSGW